MDSIENISLKILRMLYYYRKENSNSGLIEEVIEEKFEFIDRNEGRAKVKKALSGLIQLELVRNIKAGKSEVTSPLLHAITEHGIKHYEKFKFFKEEDKSASAGVVNIQGDWSGAYNYYNHPANTGVSGSTGSTSGDSTVNFPGKAEEFISHYDELLERIEAAEKLAQDSPKGESILQELDYMKVIISEDSSSLGGKMGWVKQMNDMMHLLEERIKKNI